MSFWNSNGNGRQSFTPMRSHDRGFSNPEPPGLSAPPPPVGPPPFASPAAHALLFPSAASAMAASKASGSANASGEDGSTVAEQLFPPGKISDWQLKIDKKGIANISFLGALYITDSEYGASLITFFQAMCTFILKYDEYNWNLY